MTSPRQYWTIPLDRLLGQLGTSPAGLSPAEAARRLGTDGSLDTRDASTTPLRILVRQIKSPLLWLLLFAAALSAATRQWTDAIMVFAIVAATVGIGYAREHRAESAVAALRQRIQTRATVIRDGQSVSVPRGEVVVGDVVRLSAGSLVPADAVVLEATDCFVTESALTGESYPVQKRTGVVAAAAGLGDRTNVVFLGTNVRSGTALCVVTTVGRSTEIGAIVSHLSRKMPETDFDRGIRRFGYLLTSAMLFIVLVVFAAHMLAGRPPVETLLFSVALAVGLSPELLPAILTMNLARGAQVLAKRGVLVRRLNAIENLGSMNVLCTDKTGTLTEGTVKFDAAYDAEGRPSDAVLEAAAINASLQTGLANPLDEAILAAHQPATAVRKLGEIPFDFVRRRLTVVVEDPRGARLITKGAFASIVGCCTRSADGAPLDDAAIAAMGARYEAWSRDGIRVVAVATKVIPSKPAWDRTDESDLTLAGFVTFLDRPKAGVDTALQDLSRLGVAVKMITGDNRLVAQHIASLVGMAPGDMLTGSDLAQMDDVALWREAPRTSLFAEVDPNQKERIILALRKSGLVVGFLGDGVNDAPAMHAADTSLSVDDAVDVARETADFVLMQRDLDVIRGGIEEGRRTFANTMKYILTTIKN